MLELICLVNKPQPFKFKLIYLLVFVSFQYIFFLILIYYIGQPLPKSECSYYWVSISYLTWLFVMFISSLAHRVVSLDKELYSTLSLFIQEYKWAPATYCWGITLRWTSIPSGGGGKGVAILLFYYLMVTNIQSWMRRILKIKNIY